MFVSFNNLSYKKYHKINMGMYNGYKLDRKVFLPSFCNFGFKLLNSVYITKSQVEAIRSVVSSFFKKNVFLKVNLMLNLPLTKKSVSASMGKGKGKFDKWVSPLVKGSVFYELLSFDSKSNSKKYYYVLLKKVNSKLPIKMCLVSLKY